MSKKMLGRMAVAAAILGMAMTAAPQAVADDDGPISTNGNGTNQSYGNASTSGPWSPQFSLVQGSLNKPCVALPAKANLGGLADGNAVASVVNAAVPVTVQDIPVLSSPQTQQCNENSTQQKGDEPLSHLLDDLAVLSGGG